MEWGAVVGGSCLCVFVSVMHDYEREHALLKGVDTYQKWSLTVNQSFGGRF